MRDVLKIIRHFCDIADKTNNNLIFTLIKQFSNDVQFVKNLLKVKTDDKSINETAFFQYNFKNHAFSGVKTLNEIIDVIYTQICEHFTNINGYNTKNPVIREKYSMINLFKNVDF